MKSRIELRHLRYFLAVAETLHFGKAAARLGMAQPPLSQQIRTLENILGYRLFDRTTRGVQLTTVGRYFLERTRNTLERIDQDVKMTRRLGAGQEGVLAVGFSGSVMFTELPLAIEQYRRAYPKVELQLHELVTAEQISALKAGNLDLAFLRDGDPDDSIEMEPFLRERFVAILPKRHRLAEKSSLRPSDLQTEPFVFYARTMGPLAFDRMMACCEADGFRPRIVQDTPQWPTALRLIAAGLGVSIAPACVTSLVLPDIVYISLRSAHRTSIDIGRRRSLDNPAADAFLRIVHQQFSKRTERHTRL
jgi:DNA-binding transcriptional LysR family regulator